MDASCRSRLVLSNEPLTLLTHTAVSVSQLLEQLKSTCFFLEYHQHVFWLTLLTHIAVSVSQLVEQLKSTCFLLEYHQLVFWLAMARMDTSDEYRLI